VEPVAALPLTSGLLSLDGESGSVSVIVGAPGAWVSTVKVRDAGVWSVFPARSVALTSRLWEPSGSEAVVWGEAQEEKEPPSILHWKLDPPSLEETSKVGVGSLIVAPSAGPESLVVWGAVEY
jgi:hypothetical protein